MALNELILAPNLTINNISVQCSKKYISTVCKHACMDIRPCPNTQGILLEADTSTTILTIWSEQFELEIAFLNVNYDKSKS